MLFEKELSELRKVITSGSEDRRKQQLEAGKGTARERVEALLDAGSFVEMDALVSSQQIGAGVITGWGTVEDRPVYVFAQDFAVKGGAMGQLQSKKIVKLLSMAVKTGAPVVALLDSAGVRVDEGAQAMGAYSEVAHQLIRMSGVCPMLAVVCGPCMGSAATLAQLCDLCIVVEKETQMSVFGPQVMAAMNGLQVNAEQSGGAALAVKSGLSALCAATEAEAIAKVRALLDLLPSSNLEDADLLDTDDLNRKIAATEPAALAQEVADAGSAMELFAGYEPAIRVFLARVGGHSAMLIAACGKLTAGALTKAARMVRFADCYHLPVISLLDTCGVTVDGIEAQAALIKAQAQLMYAFGEATAPKLCVVCGKAVGQAYVAMGGKGNADIAYAWPSAVISALTPEAAAAVLFADEIKADTELTVEAAREKYAQRYVDETADAVHAAACGMVDDIIAPETTRAMLIAALEMLSSKRDSGLPKKHGNLPL